MTVHATEPVALTTVTEPEYLPVTLEEAKDHLRVDHSDDDAYISGQISAATSFVERYTNRAFVPQTLRLTLQDFPGGGSIELPRSPISSNSTDVSVSYFVDGSSSTTTFGSTKYIVDHEHEPPQLTLQRDESWPTVELRSRNAVRVDFLAGYDSVGEVPEAAKLGIKMLVSNWYENREPLFLEGAIVPRALPWTVKALLDSIKVHSFG